MNDAITQMDQVTQQNAALVEESAAAASSLREQAETLAQAVAVFKLSQQSSRQAIATAQSSAKAAMAEAKPAAKPVAAKPAGKRPAAPAPVKAATEGSSAKDNWEEF